MALERKIASPSSVSSPIGLYSQVARVKASEFLFVAGQVALDGKGNLVGPGDVSAQIKQSFANIAAILESEGASLDNVVEFTTYFTSADSIPIFMKTRTELFKTIYASGVYPPNTLLIVSRLVKPEFLVEISAVAAV